jgi:prepilin-type N-terminal cleavage/methylation domain-containing protein
MNRNRAFTLLEILLAIGIIALLAAILLPVIAGAKASGQVATATSNARQIVQAVLQYASDSDEKAVPSQIYATSDANRKIWPELLESYLKGNEILAAPGAEPVVSRKYPARGTISWGLNAETALNRRGCSASGHADQTCAGYREALSLESIGGTFVMLATTPAGPTSENYCGFEFEPNNGAVRLEPESRTPPLISDRDMVKLLPTVPCVAMRPVFGRYGSTGRDDGRAVMGLSDGSVKVGTVKQVLSGVLKLDWRPRRIRQ